MIGTLVALSPVGRALILALFLAGIIAVAGFAVLFGRNVWAKRSEQPFDVDDTPVGPVGLPESVLVPDSESWDLARTSSFGQIQNVPVPRLPENGVPPELLPQNDIGGAFALATQIVDADEPDLETEQYAPENELYDIPDRDATEFSTHTIVTVEELDWPDLYDSEIPDDTGGFPYIETADHFDALETKMVSKPEPEIAHVDGTEELVHDLVPLGYDATAETAAAHISLEVDSLDLASREPEDTDELYDIPDAGRTTEHRDVPPDEWDWPDMDTLSAALLSPVVRDEQTTPEDSVQGPFDELMLDIPPMPPIAATTL